MAFDFNLTRIENTDTFTEWADKCNAIIDGLNTTDFITSSAGFLTLASNQTITGQKAFTQSVTLTRGFTSTGSITSTGDFTLGGTTGIINAPTLQINSGSFTTGSGVELIGSKGISFKSSSTSSIASLKFENAGTPEKLQFDYSGIGEGNFEIVDGNRLTLAGSSPTIGVNNYQWDLPATSPGSTPSLLKWSGTGSQLEWLAQTTLASDILADVIAGVQESNFTLPVTLIPVGTMVAVDARILDDWPADSPEAYGVLNTVPGWIPCAGQTISYDENSSPENTLYKELVELLEGIDSPSGSTTLPDTVGSPGEEDPIGGNAIVYLIKYKSDDSTVFAVSTTTGVAGASGISLFDTSNAEVGSFDITGGKIGLNIDTDDFAFGVGGKLSLADDVDTTATANTIAKRDSDGTLAVATPTADTHATTKAFVDALAVTLRGETGGSVIAFPELRDGHQTYTNRLDNHWGMSFVDRLGRGVFTGSNTFERNSVDVRANVPQGWFNAISPVTDKEAVFERTFTTSRNYFFIDGNGIIYGTGRNNEGQIGQRDRGTGTDFTDYYTQFHGSGERPYNDTAVETPVPALLPQKTEWDANAVTIDTVSYNARPDFPLLIAKTKDGIGNEYNSNDRLQGLERYETSSAAVGGAGVAYTRGWLIGSGSQSRSELGTGAATSTSYTSTGPRVFGLNSAGSSLWAVFGLTDAERADGISALTAEEVAKVNKRFHYYKRNATLKGGLSDTDDEAATTAWRLQLGFPDDSPGVLFDHYSYYVKKVVVNDFASYLIVGKPGNESDNEVWMAGYGAFGASGNGTSASNIFRHVPVTDGGTTSSLLISVVGGTSNRVYESSTAHGFEDFEQLRIGGSATRYYIIRGDASNTNLTTRFRLFSGETAAYNALANGGTTSGHANAAIASQVITHCAKVKGIFDISVGFFDSDGGYVLARRTTDTTTDATDLDALPESDFASKSVMSWGYNGHGELGQGSTTNKTFPTTVSLGTTDTPVDIIAVADGANTFVITENTDGNRSVRVAGDNSFGLADAGTAAGNTTTFTISSTIDANWWVKEVFVSQGAGTGDNYRGSIFIVAQSKSNSDNYALFAGGRNMQGHFGTSQHYNASTLNYLRVPFPEDPKNITAMQNMAGDAYFALCKTAEAGETAAQFAAKSGRTFGTGWATYHLGNTSNRNKTSWHPVDQQILST